MIFSPSCLFGPAFLLFIVQITFTYAGLTLFEDIISYSNIDANNTDDPTNLLSNTVNGTSSANWTFPDIVQIGNTMDIARYGGVEGILFDLGTACNPFPSSFSPNSASASALTNNKITQIALIARGNCTFYQKMITANSIQVSVIIIYDVDANNNSVNYPSHFQNLSNVVTLGGVGNIGIPYENMTNEFFIPSNHLSSLIEAIFVSAPVGSTLLGLLQQYPAAYTDFASLSQNASNVTSSTTSSSVPTMPALALPDLDDDYVHIEIIDTSQDSSAAGPWGWSFTMLTNIVVLIVLLGIATIVYTHLRRQSMRNGAGIGWNYDWRRMAFAGSLESLSASWRGSMRRRQVLSKEMVDSFPSRVIPTPLQLTSNTKSDNSDMTPKADLRAGDTNCSIESEQNGAAAASSSVSTIITSPSHVTCPVCLEDFAAGETVRTLPCRHEYHLPCIEIWLTQKSSLCPMCKFDCFPAVQTVSTSTQTIEIDTPIIVTEPSTSEMVRLERPDRVILRERSSRGDDIELRNL